ncbi:MAG: DUF2059 domain-containing protein [Rhodospirillaceae bacterium]
MTVRFSPHLRTLSLALALVLVGLLSLPQTGQANEDKRLAAAEAYEQVLSVRALVDRVMAELMQISPPESRAALKDFLDRDLDVGKIRILYIHALAETFTEAELNALTAFYRTAEGQAVLAKMPRFMSGTLPMIQGEVLRGLERFKQRLPQ